MPSHAPRTEPVKKQEELTKREIELILGIKKNIPADKLLKLVDKYRKAQLSMLKAKVHTFKENEFTAYFLIRDILNQNTGIERNFYGNTSTEVRNQRLRQYWMIGFTWDFKNKLMKP